MYVLVAVRPSKFDLVQINNRDSLFYTAKGLIVDECRPYVYKVRFWDNLIVEFGGAELTLVDVSVFCCYKF